jgi:hypothetical protein
MDNFFIIIPFLVPVMVMYIVYKQYKNKRNAVEEYEKRLAWFEKNRWLRYIKTIYIDRGVVRFWSAIWYVPLLFCTILGTTGLIGHIQGMFFPPIPLKQMSKQEGVIQSIQFRKKMDDLIIFKPKNSNRTIAYSIHDIKKVSSRILHKPVQIWFTRGWSSAFSIDNIIYQIKLDEERVPIYSYNYKRRLKVNQMSLTFALNCLYIAFFSAFMIWIQNRKEKPYHRLYRLKRSKKLQKLKGEK